MEGFFVSTLQTEVYGIPIKSPVVVGACTLTARPDKVKDLENAGAGAVIVKSLFEEEIQLEKHQLSEQLERYNDLHAEMITHFPHLEHSGDAAHIQMVKKIKQEVSIPVIASLNAVTMNGWTSFAKDLEKAGVDGLELNFYSLPSQPNVTAEDIINNQIEVIKHVKNTVNIPVGIKLSPYYTHLTNVITDLNHAGADGFTLFNRFFQPDIDIMSETESVTFSFSGVQDDLLAIQWIALLSDRIDSPLTASNGILDYEEAVKAILVGSKSVQVVSALYKNGIDQITKINQGINKWMELKEYLSISDFCGKMSKSNLRDPWAYERVQYIEMLLKKSSFF